MNQRIDLIYFFSSLVMVAVPLMIFTTLTYFVARGYFRSMREKGEGRGS